jgi:hypothetical protein
MTSILIKNKQGGLRVFSLVRWGSEVKCLRTTGLRNSMEMPEHPTDSNFQGRCSAIGS